MLRRWSTRGGLALVVAGVLLPVSLVTTSVPAQALSGVEVLPSDRWAIKAVGGLVDAPPPKQLARGARVCLKPSPAAAACALGVLALIGLGASKDMWWPWMLNKLGVEEQGNNAGAVSVPCATAEWASSPYSGITIQNFPTLSLTNTGAGMTGFGSNGNSCDVAFDVTSSVKSTGGVIKTRTTPVRTTFSRCPTNCSVSVSFGWPSGFTSTDQVLTLEAVPVPATSSYIAGEGSANGKFFKAALSEQDLSVKTVVRCQRPDTSEYDVERVGQPNLGYVKVGYCEAGDSAIGWKLVENGITHMDIDTRPDPADSTTYPLCAGAACGYNVRLDNQPCVEGDGRCEDWARIAQESPSRTTCWYGPYKLAIEECYWLERAYNTQRYPLTGPNTDGDPDTITPPPEPAPSPSPSPTSTTTPTQAPAPSVTATATTAPSPGTCVTPYNLGPVQSQTAALVNNLAPRFGVTTVYGWREADAFPDHPSGLAADFMTYTNSTKGTSLATYAIQNAPVLNVDYVIWQQRIWSLDRAAEGWRVMADRGSLTANHYDHVHITVKAVAGSLACSGDPGDSDPASTNCWPTGWGSFNPGAWVLQPIKCAFIPDAGHLNASVDGLITKVKAKGPGALIDQLGGVGAQLDNATGCAGPSVPFDVGDFHLDIELLNACSGQMATVAGYVKAFLTVGISVGGVAGVVRGIGSGFGWSFSLGRGNGSGDV